MNDLELVQAVLRGESAAREELARRLAFLPSALARLECRSGGFLGREDRRDLAQDVVLALWVRLPSYSGAAPLEAWARGFCANAHRNAVRKRRRRARIERGFEHVPWSDTPDPARTLARAELCARLARLGAVDTQAILLKCVGELTFEEIGARLALSPNTVKTAYYRGLRRLAQGLAAT